MGDAKLDVQSSQVADALSAATTALDEAADHLSGFTEEAKDDRPALHRADSAVALGRALIGLADPTTTSEPIANEVREPAEALRNQLSQAAADGGGNIGPQAEKLLTALARLRSPIGPSEEAAKEAALRFRQSLDPRLRGVRSEIDRIEEVLNQVGESAGTQAEGLVQRLDTLKEEIDAANARVQESISEQDANFATAQEERRKEFAQSLANAEENLADIHAQLEQRREEGVARLEEIEESIANTAAAAGGRATAMGHGKESAEQADLAFRWSVATILLLLAAAGVPIALGVLHADQSPESVAGKLTVALIIAGVAGYAAGIARHHRERSASARKLELEMNSFGTFVAPLDPADQNDLRSTIIWRFFGPEHEPQEPDSEPRPRHRLRELLHFKQAKHGRSSPSSSTPGEPTEAE